MKKSEVIKALKSNKILCCSATEFLSSTITWNEDNINPEEYMVEILHPDNEKRIMVTFVKEDEWRNKVYNSDFSEYI
jgi:hypothetical protein